MQEQLPTPLAATMPIQVNSKIHIYSADAFHELAEQIIGVAFGIHNEFGRLMEEGIYVQTLRQRCAAKGIPAQAEVGIKVCHQGFTKRYFMDLLFSHGLMVEAKAVEKLKNVHHTQALHYLLLADMPHGLLLNFRPSHVEKRFVSTSLDYAERRRYFIRDAGWDAFNEVSVRLRKIFIDLLEDWGAFLQIELYREAVVHFFGGPECVLQKIPVYDGRERVGTHKVALIAADTALSLTAIKADKESMRSHLQRFLNHTMLNCIQWVNLDNHDVELITLER